MNETSRSGGIAMFDQQTISARDAAKNGATLLDEKIPQWYQQVDKHTLDTSKYNACIIFHVCICEPGVYDVGANIPGLADTFWHVLQDDLDLWTFDESVSHGFNTSDMLDDIDAALYTHTLTTCWILEINARLDPS
jgi:hypothetical protein